MTLTADLQTLSPGAWVVLWELDMSALGAGKLYFHGYQMAGTITWQGTAYEPWGITATGFEVTGGQPPTPKLSVANVDGRITALCLIYQDLVGAKLIRHRTLAKYLDGQPTADPAQEATPDMWIIERRSAETNVSVTFELSSALDFQTAQLPGQTIIANTCGWLLRGGYRGPYCGYTGPAVAQLDDTPTTNLALDRCGGRLSSCKLRFGADAELPFGGAPGATLIK